MSKVFHIGDLHFGHKNILKYRSEFASIEEHDAVIIDNIGCSVSKRDTLWLHGDCFFTLDALRWLHAINANRIHWIIGNHDSDNAERQKVIYHGINSGIVDSVHSLVKYKEFWLSHAPIHSDELRGKMNIHGHVHRNSIADSRYFNVSCENVNYAPITTQEIRERISM